MITAASVSSAGKAGLTREQFLRTGRTARRNHSPDSRFAGSAIQPHRPMHSRRGRMGRPGRDLVRHDRRLRSRLSDRAVQGDADRRPRVIHRRGPFLLRRRAARFRPSRRRERMMAWSLASGLEGKRVLVTGGAGGIGREVALAFGAAGSRVAVVDLAEEKVRAVVAEIEGGPHLPLAAISARRRSRKTYRHRHWRAWRARRSRLRRSGPRAPGERG